MCVCVAMRRGVGSALSVVAVVLVLFGRSLANDHTDYYEWDVAYMKASPLGVEQEVFSSLWGSVFFLGSVFVDLDPPTKFHGEKK